MGLRIFCFVFKEPVSMNFHVVSALGPWFGADGAWWAGTMNGLRHGLGDWVVVHRQQCNSLGG